MEDTISYALGRLFGAAAFGLLVGLAVWGVRVLAARLRSGRSTVSSSRRVASSLTVGFVVAVLGALPGAGERPGMLLVALLGLLGCGVWWLTSRHSGGHDAELPSPG